MKTPMTTHGKNDVTYIPTDEDLFDEMGEQPQNEIRNELNKHDDEINKLFGPTDKKIKNVMNKKLRKKHKMRQKQEEKNLLDKVGDQEDNLFDFIRDFSSSDYESVSEDEMKRIEQEQENNRMNEQKVNAKQQQQKGKNKKVNASHNDGLMSPDQSRDSKQQQYDNNKRELFQKLMSGFTKFEKRKRVRPQKFYQLETTPIIIQPEDLERVRNIAFRDIDLKNKIKKVFKPTLTFIGKGEDDDSLSDSKRSTNKEDDDNQSQKSKNTQHSQRLNVPQGSVHGGRKHLKSGPASNSGSAISPDDGINHNLLHVADANKAINKSRALERSTIAGGKSQKPDGSAVGDNKSMIDKELFKKDQQQQKLNKIKNDIKNKISYIKNKEELQAEQNEHHHKIIIKEIEDPKIKEHLDKKDKINREKETDTINTILRLKQTIGMKLRDLQEEEQKENQYFIEQLQEIDQREEWMMQLKTHIGKFQTDVIAFSLKKYFNRWKKINEEYKARMAEQEKAKGVTNTFEMMRPKKDETKATKDDENEEEKNNHLMYQKQFEVFQPSDKIKKKLLPYAYNIYRPKKNEE